MGFFPFKMAILYNTVSASAKTQPKWAFWVRSGQLLIVLLDFQQLMVVVGGVMILKAKNKKTSPNPTIQRTMQCLICVPNIHKIVNIYAF